LAAEWDGGNGQSIKALARKHGLDPVNIRRQLLKLGVKSPGTCVNDRQPARIAERVALLKVGHTPFAIARPRRSRLGPNRHSDNRRRKSRAQSHAAGDRAPY
ncbi:MAG: hypothetical protein M1823_006866, partial [Watsoniomyces obsoletus]